MGLFLPLRGFCMDKADLVPPRKTMGFQAPPPEPIRLFLCPPSQKPVFDLAAGKKIPLNGTSGGEGK